MNLENSFEDRKVEFISFYWLINFSDFAQNSFEKRQATSSQLSNQFCENPANVAAIRKEGIKRKGNSAPIYNIQKSFAIQEPLVSSSQEFINSL